MLDGSGDGEKIGCDVLVGVTGRGVSVEFSITCDFGWVEIGITFLPCRLQPESNKAKKRKTKIRILEGVVFIFYLLLSSYLVLSGNDDGSVFKYL